MARQSPVRTLGREVSENLLSQIENTAPEAARVETASLLDEVSEAIRGMFMADSAMVVFVRGTPDLQTRFLKAPGFSDRWRQATPRFNFGEYIGDIGTIPVFFVYDTQVSRITAVDLARIGTLTWYCPQKDNTNGLLVTVTEIDETEANRIVDAQPDFLKGQDGSVRSREAAIRDLRLKVRVFVGVKLELAIEAPDAMKKMSQ